MGSGACHHSLPRVWGQVERLSPSWACRPARLAGSCRLQEGWSLVSDHPPLFQSGCGGHCGSQEQGKQEEEADDS